jgi:ubiquinol-cytochrome c reductase cytochrome b subunit
MRFHKSFFNVRIVEISLLNMHLIDYPTPININYLWGFGFLGGMCLSIQIISGILLSMHYSTHILLAFSSIEHIMRDVNNGWFLRYVHSNGASIFFIIVYMHMGRSLYFKSYRNKNL